MNFGGDPEGKLAKALERARKKAKQPRKPLKIERLKAEKIDYSSWICPVEEEFDFGEGMEKYECGSTDYRIVKDSASPTGHTVECSSCRSDISYDYEPYLQAKEAYEEKERKRIKQRYGAESPQVDDEGMLGRIRKVRIVGIEDNSGKKDRNGNPIQDVYFYRDLLDSGEADWRIHTDSEREFLSRFKPDKRAESFGADYHYDGDRRSGFSIVKGGFKYGKDRIGGTTLATITKGNALQAHYWKGDEARARRDANRTMWKVHLKENNVRRSFSKRQDAIDFVFSTLGISKEDMEAEFFGAEAPSYMADSDAHKLMEASWRINSFVESGEEYPQWWKSKLSVAASNVDDLADYLDYAMSDDYDAESFGAESKRVFSSSTTFKGKWEKGVTRKIDDVDVTKVSWNRYVVEYKGCLGLLEDADIGEGYWRIRFEDDNEYIVNSVMLEDYNFNGDWNWLWKKIGRNQSDYTAYTTKATHWKEGAVGDFKEIVDRLEDGHDLIRNVITSHSETFNAPYPQHNPYSVDLIEEEGQHPYYPYLAPEYTNVVGRGRYRFNRYGTDGMTWYQYRFPTKDKAIEWLCYQPQTYVWKKPNQPQYDFPPNTPESEIKKWQRAESYGAEDDKVSLRVWAKDREKDHLGYFVSKNKDGWETWQGLCGITSDKGISRGFNVSNYDGSYGRRCRKCLTAYKKMGAEFNAKERSIAKRSWDALNNVETAVGTVGLAHMIGLGAIFGGGLAFLKGRKSNSKTEK